MLRSLVLTIAAAAAIGLAASATPAQARVAGITAPAVEANKIDVRCHHHRRSSRYHCPNRHRHWHHRHHWHAQPFYYQPHHFHQRWHSRRHHRHHRHW
ncbi:MAG: hypothetical protein IPK23_11290 [Rhizobiales bacterium]|jgi:hypothetical protein|nr:hypothetical protein [Hyphomicrobiales bacterium]